MKKIIRSILKHLGYTLNSTKYILKPFLKNHKVAELNFDHIVAKYILLDKKGDEGFNFLQIGTFDGIISDPIRKYIVKFHWYGIMLEPQPIPFAKLEKLYFQNKNVVVLNYALGETKGVSKIYTLEGDELPEWSKGMASFSKPNILKHKELINNLEDYIKEIEIKTINFKALFTEQCIERLDLLQIDTEGYDATILNLFPFHKLKPAIIHFESKHIAKLELEKLLDKLIKHGYSIAKDGAEDMTAVLEIC